MLFVITYDVDRGFGIGRKRNEEKSVDFDAASTATIGNAPIAAQQ